MTLLRYPGSPDPFAEVEPKVSRFFAVYDQLVSSVGGAVAMHKCRTRHYVVGCIGKQHRRVPATGAHTLRWQAINRQKAEAEPQVAAEGSVVECVEH